MNIVDELLLNHFPRLLKCRDYFKLSFPLKNVLELFYALLLSALFRKSLFKTCFFVNQSARLEASGWREKMQPQSVAVAATFSCGGCRCRREAQVSFIYSIDQQDICSPSRQS